MAGPPSHPTLRLVLHRCGPAAGMALSQAVILGPKTGGCSWPHFRVEPNLRRKQWGRLAQEEKDKLKVGRPQMIHMEISLILGRQWLISAVALLKPQRQLKNNHRHVSLCMFA